MKLRSLVVFGAGVAVGVSIMRRLTADDPEIVHGPQRRSDQNPTLRLLTDQTARLSDRATVLSLDAIRRAREAIRDRMAQGEFDDDAAWR